MNNSKPNIVTDYDSLAIEQKEKLKLIYPDGFGKAIIEFTDKNKKTLCAIRWETADKVYLLRLSDEMLVQLMEEEDELDNIF